MCKVINICHLRVSVADKAMLKLKSNIINAVNCLFFNKLKNNFEELEKEIAVFIQSIFQVNLISLLIVSKNNFSVAKLYYNT